MKMHIEIKLCLDATLLLWFRNPGVGLFLQNNFNFIVFGNFVFIIQNNWIQICYICLFKI